MSQVTWYFKRDGETFGPVGHEEMCRLVSDGTVPLDAKVRGSAFPGWVDAGRIEGFRVLANQRFQPPQQRNGQGPPPLPRAVLPAGVPSGSAAPPPLPPRGP